MTSPSPQEPPPPHITSIQHQQAVVSQRPAGDRGEVRSSPPTITVPLETYEKLLHKEQLLSDVLRIYEQTNWPATTRFVWARLHIEPGAVSPISGEKQLAMRQEDVAKLVGLGTRTVRNIEEQLASVGVIHRNTQRTAIDRATGRPLSARELRQRSPDTYTYITASRLIERPLPDELPEAPPTTAYNAQQRQRASAQRAEAKANTRMVGRLQAQIHTLTCPECGTQNSLTVACTSCRSILPPYEDSNGAPPHNGEVHHVPAGTLTPPHTAAGADACNGEVHPYEHTVIRQSSPLGVAGDDLGEIGPPSPLVHDEWAALLTWELSSPGLARRGLDAVPLAAEVGHHAAAGPLTDDEWAAIEGRLNTLDEPGQTPQDAEAFPTQAPARPHIPAPYSEEELAGWLAGRIGENEMLTYQAHHRDPHKYLPFAGHFDIGRYLLGDSAHLYGSRPGLEGGRAWFISYDIDPKFGATDEVLLQVQRALLGAGLRSQRYARRGGSYRLEMHFDAPVSALGAHMVALRAAPVLAELSDEVFPVSPGGPWRGRETHNYGWPLWYLDEHDHPQESPAVFVSEWGEWHAGGIRSDRAGMLAGLGCTLNRAGLIPEPLPNEEGGSTSVRARAGRGGGVSVPPWCF